MTSPAGMVSADEAPPVVKSDEDTVAVQVSVSAARASVTNVVPKAPLAVPLGMSVPPLRATDPGR